MKMDSSVKTRGKLSLQVVIFFVFILCSITVASDDANLVGWWKFDEGAGEIAHDSSGNGNHITLLINQGYKDDPVYVKEDNFAPGVSGYCMQLDGKWQTAYTPHDDVLKPAKEMTISVWLRADTLEKAGLIYHKEDGGSYGAAVNTISIEGDPGSFKFRFTLNAGGTRRRMDAPITEANFADDQWHLYTCTYDGNDMKTHKDGVVIAQLNCPGEIGVCGNSNLYLGSLGNYCPADNPGVVHFDGLLDDLRVYSKALTQEEIEALMGLSEGPTEPMPNHGEKSVYTDTILSWKGSGQAESFDVYLGTQLEAVEYADKASDEFMGNQLVDSNSFDPNGLESGVFYYWRIDEVNGFNITKGHVWNFETVGFVDENLIGWWKFDEEGGNMAFDSSGKGNHAIIAGSPSRQEGLIGNAVEFFGTREYAAVPNEGDYDISGNLTLSVWIKISELDSSSMYIISKSESYLIYKDLDSNLLTFQCEGTGRPLTGTIDVVDGQWHHVVGVYDGSKKYIYIDGQLDMSANSAGAVVTNDNAVRLGGDAVWPECEFHGLMDDARIYNKALAAGDVMALAGVRFSKAHEPNPADGMSYVATDKVLSFEAGSYATSHDIYLGTDFEAVKNADSLSAEYKGNHPSASYAATFELDRTYYWRVDEINDTDIWTGDVWSFTTLDETMDPNLVGYWKLESQNGFKAYDASGNENHGNLGVHSVWSNGNYHALYVGSDTDGGVEIENEYPFDITDEITIATWILNDGWARWDGSDVIIGKADAYKLYRNGSSLSADSVRFTIDGVGQVETAPDTAVANAKWRHIAATYDGSTMKLYVDGELDNSVSASGAIPMNNLRLWLGNDPESRKDCERAYLREARVYNRALNAAEIAVIALPTIASEPNPVDKVNSISDANVTLSWRAGKNSEWHLLYFSSDYYSVNNGISDGNLIVADLTIDSNSYSLEALEKGRYYYWRVDQINGGKAKKGDVWSFYVPLCDGGNMAEDVDMDCVVNLSDFAVVANGWTEAEANDSNVVASVAFESVSMAGDADIKLSLNGIAVGLGVDEQGFATFETGDDVQWLSKTGEPAIAYKTATVLLPGDVDMSTVKAEFTEAVYKRADGSWQVKPVGPMVTWIDGQEVTRWPEGKAIVDGKDVGIYENNALWPAEEIVFTGKGQLRKFNVATIAVPLVRWNAVTGELVRLAMADISVTYSTGVTSQSALIGKADVSGRGRVANMAVNFDQMIEGYDSGVMELSDCGDGPLRGYIIITTNFIVDNSAELDNFIAHKQARGFDVSVVTEDDFGGGSGSTAAKNIRAWLQDNWVDDGISDYVLFIGNPDPGGTVPMKTMEYSSYGASPSDFYYATLTGSWDLDGDGNYGEGSSDVSDAYYEVMVGRIPFYGVFEDLDHILAKTIDYECQFANESQWRKNTLSAMKPLNTTYGTSWAFGEDMRIDIFDPAGWPYHKMYDLEHLPAGVVPDTTPCSVYNVTDVWSKGRFGSMVYSTHGGSDNNAGVMNLDLLSNMNDRYPSMGFAASCLTAKPETRRNLTYSMLLNSCIGICGSTRLSWYSPSQTNFNNSGSCEGQGYEFYERIVQGMTAGKALYEMKQQQQFSWWQNNMILSLYGDPAIRVMPAEPGDLNNDGFFDMQDMAILSKRWLDGSY